MTRVLVVEDDRELRRGLAIRLRASGYDVLEAGDGMQAIKIASEEKPDVILLDIGLPGEDGFSVLDRAANIADLSTIPVIILTGRDPRANEPQARARGVAGFLVKPAENEELLTMIDRAARGLWLSDAIERANHPRERRAG